MKTINANAPVLCHKTIAINASREKVWDILVNINQWASWQTNILNPKLQGDLKAGSTFVWKSGGAKIRSTLHHVEPCKAFGWTGKAWGTFGIHNWTLESINGQTHVATDESMEGFVAGLFRKALKKSLDHGNETWLKLLKIECEK